MRYQNFLLNEDAVSKALGLGEPKVGGDYASEKVKRYIKIIDDALTVMKKKEESDANDAIVQDLRDKKKKWKNVDKETKPTKTVTEQPPEQQKEEPPPPEEEEPPPPKEEQPKESRMRKYLGDFNV